MTIMIDIYNTYCTCQEKKEAWKMVSNAIPETGKHTRNCI